MAAEGDQAHPGIAGRCGDRTPADWRLQLVDARVGAVAWQLEAGDLDNYLHTKSALIDNRWVMVGSANLDGASLDYIQYARAFLDGDVRNTEANLVVFEETGTLVSAVDALRRQLWAEHLGIANPQDAALDDAPGKDWCEGVARFRDRPKRTR